MEAIHFISGTPLGIIIAVCVAGYTAYIAYRKQRNEQEDRLIDILEKTVAELEKKVNKQEETIKTLVGKVEDFEKLNREYKEILENRDEKTMEFMRKALEAMSKVDVIHDGLGELLDMLSGHLKAIGCGHGITDEGVKVVE